MAEIVSTPNLIPSNPTFIAFKSDLVTVRVDAPLPPGSRVAFDLKLERGNKTLHLAGKVTTVSKASEGHCRMTVRIHTVSRTERADLTAENAP